MNLINNMKIKYKLLVMVLLPVFYLAYLSVDGVIEKRKVTAEMKSLAELSTLAVNISSLVHELQKERGATAGFLGSKGTKFVTELPAQRKLTDERMKNLNDFASRFNSEQFGSEFKSLFTNARSQAQKIESIRTSVTNLDIQTGAAIGYYTKMNAAFLNTIGYMSKLSTNNTISESLNAYVNFLQGKERAGIERAVLSNTFARDNFGPGMFEKFISLVTAQDTYINVFLSFADEGNVELYKDKVKGAAVDEVDRMRGVAKAKAVEGGFGIESVYWFKTITKKINLLKEVENHLSEDLRKGAETMMAAANSAERAYMIVTLLIFFLTFSFSYILSVKTITGPTQKVADMANSMAEGHVGMTLEIRGRDEVGLLAGSFNRMSQNMKELIGGIFDASNQIASSAEQISASSEQMAQGAESQNRQAEQVATAVEEMSATVLEVARNSNNASDAANRAVEVARKGGDVVSKSIAGMGRISESVKESARTIEALGRKSDEIGEIISVIDDIADQTNLLALNAAIEAARAGDQGRGFAVVADEVRKLAERTTTATKEIAGMIKSIQGETEGAVKSMAAGTEEVEKGVEYTREAGEALNEIVSVIDDVNGMIQQIATAAEEQSAAAEEISCNIERVASVSRETSAGVQQSTVATQELSKLATSLQTRVQQFEIAA